MARPLPPPSVLEEIASPLFTPADDLAVWAFETFIADGASVANPDHAHLRFASIGALWTNVANGRAGRRIVGQAEMGLPPAGRWMRGRIEMQLIQWFGEVPDFVLTFDAQYCTECSDAEFMALVEHELYHCGQERDAFGAPKFRKSGLPAFAIRGHDFEGFVGVARRYGAIETNVAELIQALQNPPEVAQANIRAACGTCQMKLAA